MKQYELVVVCNDTSTDDDRAAVQQKIEAVVSANGGTVKTEPWGPRQLAYDIKDDRKANTYYRTGLYTSYTIDSDGSFVREIEDYLRVHDAVIRFLTLVVDEPVEITGSRPKDFDPEEKVILHYKNVGTLEKFVTERGKIVARRISRLTAKDQRRLAREIKRARMLAMMPFTTQGQ